MKKTITLFGLCSVGIILSACQTTPQQYNGHIGYQVEQQTPNTATLTYTLATKANQNLDEQKLQRACQSVLGENKTYSIQILSVQERVNEMNHAIDQYARPIGQTRASFGLSNTPDLYNSENYATRQALEAKPSTLRTLRYTCS